MSGHTPGPWEAVEATEHHGWYITSDHGNTICDLYAMSNPGFPSALNGGVSKPIPFMYEMDGPNARLIAAAPELLKCAEILAALGNDGDGRSFPTLKDCDFAIVAIAKATQP